MNNYEEILTEGASLLSENIKKHILDLLYANEAGIAFEELCSYLYECDVKISENFYNKMMDVSQNFNTSSIYTDPLISLIKTDQNG